MSVIQKFVPVESKDGKTKIMVNRACPKCGGTCVVCGFETKSGYDKDGYSWDGLGVCCSECDWSLETRSANS